MSETETREVWGIQFPPSVHVGREYPSRSLAEKSLSFEPRGLLVSRFVTEWTPAAPVSSEDAGGNHLAVHTLHETEESADE
jgi:hypothetical protein